MRYQSSIFILQYQDGTNDDPNLMNYELDNELDESHDENRPIQEVSCILLTNHIVCIFRKIFLIKWKNSRFIYNVKFFSTCTTRSSNATPPKNNLKILQYS